ncbi:hypothetical protein BJX99DRAFT_224340 [Aspergillus californicus]
MKWLPQPPPKASLSMQAHRQTYPLDTPRLHLRDLQDPQDSASRPLPSGYYSRQ